MAAANARSVTPGTGPLPAIVARIDNVQPADFPRVAQAKPLASLLLSKAGVRLEWGKTRPGVEMIEIEMDVCAPPQFPPEVLAYAMPRMTAGTRIHIFMDRIRGTRGAPDETVLAYVIAHEIAHLLEGVRRHSADGVMKARWCLPDYLEMRRGRLEFSSEDVNLIQAHFNRAATATVLSATSGSR
jgi:hypothetical protein